LLGSFTKIHGYNYLRSLILPLIQVMKDMPPGHSYDMDPAKAVGQDIEQNKRNVEIATTAFLQVVTASIHSLPS
jgi:neurofibromin 1